MTVFKHKRSGLFYSIYIKYGTNTKMYIAIPIGHNNLPITNCSLSDFEISHINGAKRENFL